MSRKGKKAVVFKADSSREARTMVGRYLDNEMGHATTFQGMSFECFRCGATATAHQTHALGNVWQIIGEAGEKVCPQAVNVCEHGDHPAPVGKRFCSDACAKCEVADFDDTKASCAGICQRGRS